MTAFAGYCTNAEIVKFLDFGGYFKYTIPSYLSTNTYYLPLSTADGQAAYLVTGTISATDDGATISTANYSVNVTTGQITFTSHPVAGSKVDFFFYLNREYSDADLAAYVLLGAYKLEKDTQRVFRELSFSYTIDSNYGYDYIDYVDQKTIRLPYDVYSLSTVTVDGVTVTPSTVKIINNYISLTDSSQVSTFSGEGGSMTIAGKHGIPDTSRTSEDDRIIAIAKEANKYISALMIINSPLGRNVSLDNSYVVQKSDGSVRPDITIENQIKTYTNIYNDLVDLLKANTTRLI